jgi:ParB family transcriptional regulator, chromosome partitioning protein
MPQQRARMNTDIAKHQLGMSVGSPILAEIAKGSGPATEDRAIERIAIDLIQPNPFQPRRDFGDEGLVELAEVMKSMGFFGALLGRRHHRDIQLAYGERRVRAAKMAGLQEIPMEIRELTDEDMFNIALVENEQRRDLTQLEVGEAILKAKEAFNLSEREIAARLGKSKGYVRNRVETAMLPDDLKERLRTTAEDVFSASHARELRRIEDPDRRKFITDMVIDNGLNYQETKLAVDEETNPLIDAIALLNEPDLDETEEVIETNDSLLRQQREPVRGVERLRQQSERILRTIEQLANDTRIDRQELRVALEQLYSSIFDYASDLS